MANIDLDDNFNPPWYIKVFLWHQRLKLRTVPEPIQAWSRAPEIFIAFLRLWKSVDRKKSPIDPELRYLIAVYVSQLVQCAYCVDLHASKLLNLGAGEKIKQLSNFMSSETFSTKEKAALKYANEIAKSPVKVDGSVVIELKKHFVTQQIVELTALIAFQNMSSRFNAALDLSAYGYCKISKN